jgi:multisubunit Na+/H+ antiporter MnhB subunit
VAFLKSFAVGIIALIAYVVVLTVYPLVQMWWQERRAGSGGIGAGGIGVVFTTVGLFQFIVGLLIFALAFWWEFRRAS